ncbi:hypothetical protein NSA16_08850 [Ligilactobacillus murinus]|nr:hypothetical protein [Ligilactobacillus murinus]
MDERFNSIDKKIDNLSKGISQEIESAFHERHKQQKQQQKDDHRLLLCAMFLFGISAITSIGSIVVIIFF